MPSALLLCSFKTQGNMNLKSWSPEFEYLITSDLDFCTVCSCLHIFRTQHYLGSVDIEMVRISNIYLFIHICKHTYPTMANFECQKKDEKEIKGNGSVNSYFTIFFMKYPQFWSCILFLNSIDDQWLRWKIILQNHKNNKMFLEGWLI